MENSKPMKHLLSAVRRAVEDYQMIDNGDRIAVGISAGKDSLAMLAVLTALRRFYPKQFDLVAVTVDTGFRPPVDFSPIRRFCEDLGVEYHVISTEIYRIVFEERKEPNPCSLCSRMRRGALYTAAEQLRCTKLALGHHFDDAVETFLLNLFHEGRLGCFSPVTIPSGKGVTLIRPMLYVKESAIRYFASAACPPLPVIPSPCPEDGNTEREEMKQLLSSLERRHRGLRHRIFVAMQQGGIDGFHVPEKQPSDRAASEKD